MCKWLVCFVVYCFCWCSCVGCIVFRNAARPFPQLSRSPAARRADQGPTGIGPAARHGPHASCIGACHSLLGRDRSSAFGHLAPIFKTLCPMQRARGSRRPGQLPGSERTDAVAHSDPKRLRSITYKHNQSENTEANMSPPI